MGAAARHVAQVLVFPAVLGGTLAAAMALMDGGMPAPVVVGLLGLAAMPVIVACEWALPARPKWNRSHGDVRTDLAHALVSSGITQQALRPVVDAGAVVVAAWLAGSLGAPLWPSGWPALAQLALALVVAELPQYWLHRWEHEREWLWRFHAVHHSAPRLYFLNAARFHPVDLALVSFVGYFPLIALGCPESTIALFALFDAVFGLLQHGNVDARLGPLNRVFSMAEPHRWHHSRVLAEANTNYGSNLIVWDLVFGTFFLPRDRRMPAEIGIADMPAFPTGYLAQIAAPLRWKRVKQEAVRLAA